MAHPFKWMEGPTERLGTVLALSNGDTIRIAMTLVVWNAHVAGVLNVL